MNALARELLWFGLEHRITLNVEWVPREENTLADELSKLLVPDDFMLRCEVFQQLEERFDPHTVDIFASGSNNK